VRPGQWWAAVGAACLRMFGAGLTIGGALVWWAAR